MKCKKGFRRPTGFLTGLWLAGLALATGNSCSAQRRQNERQSFTQQTVLSDSARYRLSRSAGLLSRRQATLHWQQIAFSAPDSSGRQYPRILTSATLSEDNETDKRDTVLFSAEQKKQIASVDESQKEVKTNVRKDRRSALPILVLILLLAALIRLRKKG